MISNPVGKLKITFHLMWEQAFLMHPFQNLFDSTSNSLSECCFSCQAKAGGRRWVANKKHWINDKLKASIAKPSTREWKNMGWLCQLQLLGFSSPCKICFKSVTANNRLESRLTATSTTNLHPNRDTFSHTFVNQNVKLSFKQFLF